MLFWYVHFSFWGHKIIIICVSVCISQSKIIFKFIYLFVRFFAFQNPVTRNRSSKLLYWNQSYGKLKNLFRKKIFVLYYLNGHLVTQNKIYLKISYKYAYHHWWRIPDSREHSLLFLRHKYKTNMRKNEKNGIILNAYSNIYLFRKHFTWVLKSLLKTYISYIKNF